MIFASFGNAPAKMSFSRMAEGIDLLAKVSNEPVLVQCGNTVYPFRYARTVKFLEHDEMMKIMAQASVVILQGGWGTISEAIQLGKRIVSIPRKVGTECNHPQEEIVQFLEAQGCILGCYDISKLPEIVDKARNHYFKPLKRGSSSAIINDYINLL